MINLVSPMQKEKLILREALMEDYDSYYRIRAEKKNLFWTGYEKAPDYQQFRIWFRQRIDNPSRFLYLLFENERCLGSLNIDLYEGHAFIGYSIMQAFQQRGLATFLVSRAVEIIRVMEGISEVRAWINSHNKSSRRVAQKNGFQDSGHFEIRPRFGKLERYLLYIRST